MKLATGIAAIGTLVGSLIQVVFLLASLTVIHLSVVNWKLISALELMVSLSVFAFFVTLYQRQPSKGN
jgi:hypothetical protein